MRVDNEVIEVSRITLTMQDLLSLIDHNFLETKVYMIDEHSSYQVKIHLENKACFDLKFLKTHIEGFRQYEDNNPRDGDNVPTPFYKASTEFTMIRDIADIKR